MNLSITWIMHQSVHSPCWGHIHVPFGQHVYPMSPLPYHSWGLVPFCQYTSHRTDCGCPMTSNIGRNQKKDMVHRHFPWSEISLCLIFPNRVLWYSLMQSWFFWDLLWVLGEFLGEWQQQHLWDKATSQHDLKKWFLQPQELHGVASGP